MNTRILLLTVIILFKSLPSFAQDSIFIYDIASQSLSAKAMPAYNLIAAADSTNPSFGMYGATAMPSDPPAITYPATGISILQKAADYYSTFNFPFTSVALIKYGFNITSAIIGRRTLLVFNFDIRQANSHWRSLADASPFFENGLIHHGFSKLTPVKYYTFNSPDGNPISFAVVEVAENIGDFSGYLGLAFDTIPGNYDSLLLYNLSYPIKDVFNIYPDSVNGDTLCMKYGYIDGSYNSVFQAYMGANGEYVSPFFDAQFRLRGIRWSIGDNYLIGRKGFYFLKYVVDSLATNINEEATNRVATIYPNPAHSHFTIQTVSQPIISIELYSILGENVLAVGLQTGLEYQPGKKTPIELDISHLHPGIYFVNIQTEKGRSFQKLIVR